MKEYLISKYKEHYEQMNRYILLSDSLYDKKIEYEWGYCSCISEILKQRYFVTQKDLYRLTTAIILSDIKGVAQ